MLRRNPTPHKPLSQPQIHPGRATNESQSILGDHLHTLVLHQNYYGPSLCLYSLELMKARCNEIAVELIHFIQPEVIPHKFQVRRFVGIAMQVVKALHQHKRFVELSLGQGRVFR